MEKHSGTIVCRKPVTLPCLRAILRFIQEMRPWTVQRRARAASPQDFLGMGSDVQWARANERRLAASATKGRRAIGAPESWITLAKLRPRRAWLRFSRQTQETSQQLHKSKTYWTSEPMPWKIQSQDVAGSQVRICRMSQF